MSKRTRPSKSRVLNKTLSGRPEHRPSARRHGLSFETLEPRRLLAALTVGNATDLVNAPNVTSITALLADDGGDGISLREAITAANNTSGSDTIDFSVTGVIGLVSQLPAITTEVTIEGPGTSLLTLDAGGGATASNFDGFRIFEVAATGDLEINELTLTGGDHPNRGGAIHTSGTLRLDKTELVDNIAFHGGAIYNAAGTTTISRSRLTGNLGASQGGAIYNNDNLDIERSTLDNNNATYGGAIYNSGSVTLASSTVSGNFAENGGGAIQNQGTSTLSHSTVTDNGSYLAGGGIYYGTTILDHTIVSGNSAGGQPSNVEQSVTSGDYNVVGTDVTITGTGNVTTDDPGLLFLANNGGPTPTHAFAPRVVHPAIDAGDPNFSGPPDFDQRGDPVARVVDGGFGGNRIDIGAYERQTSAPFFVVNTTSDEVDDTDGIITLREVILVANANPGHDTITFDASVFAAATNMSIDSQLPVITDSLTIIGPGQDLLTIDGGDGADNTFDTGDGYRLLEIDDGTAAEIDVTLSGVSLTGGDGATFPAASAINGGAILNLENLTVDDSTIFRNAATSGGGIVNEGTLNLNRSTITENLARNGSGGGIFNVGEASVSHSLLTFNRGSGGAIRNASSGTLNLTASTLSGNLSVTVFGSNFVPGEEIKNAGTVNITSSTITNDRRIAIDNAFGLLLTISNSIVATNTGSAIRGSFTGSSNLIGGDPMLGPLAFNGGPTKTHALLPGSPAIDAGISSEATDQRGLARIVDLGGVPNAAGSDGTDIGAFESQAIEPIGTPPSVTSVVRDEGSALERPDLLSTFAVSFDVDVKVSVGDLIVRNDTLGGTVVDTSALTLDYDSGTNTANWDLVGLTLDPAFYSFELSSDIVSVVGNLSLDGDFNGNPGGAFVESIYVALLGDTNLDGQVNVLGDAFALVGNLGVTGGATWAQGDFNDDGNVDVLGDAFILVGRLGQSVAPPALSMASVVVEHSSFVDAAAEPEKIDIAFVTEPLAIASEHDEDRKQALAQPSSTPLQLAGSLDIDTAFESDFLIEDGLF